MKPLYSFFILSLFPLLSFANPYLGGYISYKWLPGDTLEITAMVYRNCPAGNLSPGTFRIKSGNCSFDTTVAYIVGAGEDVTPTCMNTCTPCNDTACAFPYGIALHELTAKVYLGHISCCKFDIEMKECCRADMFTTIDANQPFFISSFTDRCSNNSSSPVFTGPSMLRCVGLCLIDGPAVRDSTGSLMRYSLISARKDADSAVAYTAPYTYDKPLYFFGFPNSNLAFNPPQCRGFHLDSNNAHLSFRPMQAQSAIITMLAEERTANGEVTGSVVFDIPMIITNCPNNDPPELSGINGGNQFSASVDPGDQICFNIMSSDLNAMDSVEIRWNTGIPGSTFSVSQNGKYQNGRFCWTPNQSHVRPLPYTFTVTATDDACPINSQTVRSYHILVRDTTVSIGEHLRPELKIYPNPAGEAFYVELPLNIKKYSLQLVAADGKLVRDILPGSGDRIKISRQELAAGMYYLLLNTEGRLNYYPVIFH